MGVGLLAGVWLLWRITTPGPAPDERGACSVIVPARNESASLPTLLASVMPQLGLDDELIVVDDHSDDGTAAIAAGRGVRVVRAPEVESGWTGKTSACAAGAAVATNATLVFLDADVIATPEGFDRIVGALPVDGLLSVQPYQATGRLHEGLSMFCNVVTTMSTNAFTPLGDHVAPRVAFGSCLVTTRDAYDAVGGHASVAGNVVDEVALARRYRAAGRPVVCRGGRGTLSCRNPGGPRQLVKGWSKNLAVEMASANVFTALLAVVWLSVCAFAVWSLIASPSWASFALYIAIVVELAWMARRLGRFARSIVAFYPVALALFLVVLLCSLFVTVIRRRVNWKGRTVSVRPSA